MADITVTHSNQTQTTYNAALDTDASRGTALLDAMAAAVTGDSLLLDKKTFNIGTSTIDLSLGNTGTVNLSGLGKYTSVIKSTYASAAHCLVTAGSNSKTYNLSIIGTLANGNFQYPWGSVSPDSAFTNAVLEDCYISGGSDCIYLGQGNTSAIVKNVNADSHFDCVVTTFGVNLNIYDSTFTSTFDSSMGDQQRGIAIGGSGAVVNVYNTNVSVTGGSIDNYGYYAVSNAILNVYGGSSVTSGTDAQDLKQSGTGILTITPDVVYTTSSGTINVVDRFKPFPHFYSKQGFQ